MERREERHWEFDGRNLKGFVLHVGSESSAIQWPGNLNKAQPY